MQNYSEIDVCLNKSWGLGITKRWFSQCQSIWKDCASFKHNFQFGNLIFTDQLSRVRCTKLALLIQLTQGMVRRRQCNIFFGDISMPFFGEWIQSFFLQIYPLGGHLDGQGQLQITLVFISFGCNHFLQKHRCKVTFNEVSHHLFLGDLHNFKQ